jgi:ribosomal protein L40E
MEITLRRIGAGVTTAGDWIFLCVVLLFAALVISLVIQRLVTKVCPPCRSRVPNAATKCRYCGSDLAA